MATQVRNPTSEVSITGTWSGTNRHLLLDDYPDSANPIADGSTCSANGVIQFGFTAFSIPAGSTAISVQVLYYDFKNGSQASAIGASIRCNDTTNRNAATHNPGNGNAAIASRSDNYATNPKSGSAWTVDDINGVSANKITSFGFSVTDASPTVTVSCVQLQVTYTPPQNRGQVYNAYVELPTAPRQGRVYNSYLEYPNAPRKGFIYNSYLEYPNAPRRGYVYNSYIEYPIAPRKGYIFNAYAELPDAPLLSRFGIIYSSYFEYPNASRKGFIYNAYLEYPAAPRRGIVSSSYIELPDFGRFGIVYNSRIELPGAPRKGQIYNTYIELPIFNRYGIIYNARIEIPSVIKPGEWRYWNGTEWVLMTSII